MTDTIPRRYDLAGALLFQFIFGFVLFALLWAALNNHVLNFYDAALNNSTGLSSGARIEQGAKWNRYGWTFAPALVLSMLSTRLIARAVFENRGGVG